jgi:hypothetical protein
MSVERREGKKKKTHSGESILPQFWHTLFASLLLDNTDIDPLRPIPPAERTLAE